MKPQLTAAPTSCILLCYTSRLAENQRWPRTCPLGIQAECTRGGHVPPCEDAMFCDLMEAAYVLDGVAGRIQPRAATGRAGMPAVAASLPPLKPAPCQRPAPSTLHARILDVPTFLPSFASSPSSPSSLKYTLPPTFAPLHHAHRPRTRRARSLRARIPGH